MRKILPVAMNKNFEKLGIVEDYSSIIWTPRFYESGDFELTVPVTQKNIEFLAKDFYVLRSDDENAGIIEDRVIQRTESGAERMIVKGRFLQSILDRRIIASQTTLDGSVGGCITSILNDNIVTPSDPERRIPEFDYETVYIPQNIEAQYTGKNVLEAITDICKTYGFGFKVTMDASNRFIFKLYEGVDRTYDQDVNPWVVFSDKYDNLLSSEYEECYTNQRTAVLVAGEGEGLNRKTAWATDGTTGLLRREAYKEERNIRSNDGEITPEEYQALLEESGKESLTQFTKAFTGEVYFGSVVYRQDINLGDLCVIENSRWGLSVNARLVEVVESVSESGAYSITPTFAI